MILVDPLLPCLPLVGGVGISVDVMWVDVKRDKTKGREWWRENDWHVICCVDANCRNICSSTRSNVWNSIFKNLPRNKMNIRDGIKEPLMKVSSFRLPRSKGILIYFSTKSNFKSVSLLANDIYQLVFIKIVEQLKCVSTTDENGLSQT